MRFKKLARLLSSVNYSLVDVFTGEVYAWNNERMTVILNAKYLNMKVVNFKMKQDELVVFVRFFKF
jgi:hypothetical protein